MLVGTDTILALLFIVLPLFDSIYYTMHAGSLSHSEDHVVGRSWASFIKIASFLMHALNKQLISEYL